jgi:flagellin-like hook-associated protein FlgL
MLAIRPHTELPDAQRVGHRTAAVGDAAAERDADGRRTPGENTDATEVRIGDATRVRARAMLVAERHSQDGVSMVQAAEGALGEVAARLVRMRELATQAVDDALSEGQRSALEEAFTGLREEIEKAFVDAKFQGIALLAPPAGRPLAPGTAGALDEAYTLGSPAANVTAAGLFHAGNESSELRAEPASLGTRMWSPASDPLFYRPAAQSPSPGKTPGNAVAFRVSVPGATAQDLTVRFEQPDLSVLIGPASAAPKAVVGPRTRIRFFAGSYGQREASSLTAAEALTTPITAASWDAMEWRAAGANVVGREALSDGVGAEGEPEKKRVVLATVDAARAALIAIDASSGAVAEKRAYFVAMLDDFDAVVVELRRQRLLATAAARSIRDLDDANESSTTNSAHVTQHARASVAAHANETCERALALLKG